MRRFLLAVQFLTRIRTPQVRGFAEEDLTRSAVFFPAVGLVIGALLLVPAWLLGTHPLLAGFGLVLVWVWVTGALHLDGLGDVADGLGAAHSSPERLLEAMKDPHIGTFGVVAVLLQVLAKLVLGAEVIAADILWALLLVPAWARWSALVLSHILPALRQKGMGERFKHETHWWSIALWAVVLSAASSLLAPALLAALPVTVLVALYWRWRLGGISGDCLGASTEVVESVLLAALLVGATRL